MAYLGERRSGSTVTEAVRTAVGEASAAYERPRSDANRRARQPINACPELDCVRHRLPPGIVAAAERRAAEVGLGADRVLVTRGALPEDLYAGALASSLGATFAPLDDLSRAACPLSDQRLIEGTAAGLLPFDVDGKRVLMTTLRGLTARKLTMQLRSRPQLAGRFQITTDERLKRYVMRTAPHALGQKAAEELKTTHPKMSAASRTSRLPLLAAAAAAAIGAVIAAPTEALGIIELSLTFVFLAWAALRLLGAMTRGAAEPSSGRLPDDKLPVYTIIVALYREAACVPELVRALNMLDYPREKLDLKFAIEPRRCADQGGDRTTPPDGAVRDRHRAGHRAAYQAEGAQRRAAVRPRQFRRRL